MADLTADKTLATRGRSLNAYPLKDTVQIFAGSFIGFDKAAGRATKWADTANFVWLGVAVRGATGNAAGTVNAEVNESGLLLEKYPVTGVAGATDVGKLVYAADDNTLQLTATLNVDAIGFIKRFISGTNCDVQLFTPEEYRAFISA